MRDIREEKNKQIAQTIKATYEKRTSQACRVFTVKIQDNQLSKVQKEQLKMIQDLIVNLLLGVKYHNTQIRSE